MSRTSRPPNLRCPRCGYSQQGAISAWTDACPLWGTCTECGLEFQWSEILRPEFHAPRWCVEYAPRRPWFPLPPVLPTLLRCLWPWWFWRALKMSHDVRPRRVVLFVVVLLMGLYACLMFTQGAMAARHWVSVPDSVGPLTRSMARARLQLMRKAYANAIPNDPGYAVAVQRDMGFYRSFLSRPKPSVSLSRWEAIAEAVLTPWSSTSKGTVTSVRGTAVPYVSPRAIVFGAFGQNRAQLSGTWLGGLRKDGRLLVISLGAVASLLLLMPATFVLLPVTLAKSKVRWIHVGRVASYSLIVPIGFLGATALTVGFGIVSDDRVGIAFALAIGGCSVPGLCCWWSAAISRYMKIPHAWATTLLLVTVSFLLSMAVLYAALPDVAVDLAQILMGEDPL